MEHMTQEKFKVISPMFSYGAYPFEVEVRPSELKGLMRYIYRISCITKDTQQLYYKESELFGGTVIKDKDGKKKSEKVASPLRLQMKEFKSHIDEQPLVSYRDFTNNCFNNGTFFDISLDYRKNVNENQKQFYYNLLNLSLILGGIGKRSRRGRGCMSSDLTREMTKEEQIEFVVKQLNSMNGTMGNEIYTVNRNEVIIKEEHKKTITTLKRPVIKKIIFGEEKIDRIEVFLKNVDRASHEKYYKLKEKGIKNRKFATGYAQSGKKLASSVIISITETSEGLYPVYTFVTPVYTFVTPVLRGSKHLDKNHEEVNTYFELLEGRRAFE